jgi:hypothetical protein
MDEHLGVVSCLFLLKLESANCHFLPQGSSETGAAERFTPQYPCRNRPNLQHGPGRIAR